MENDSANLTKKSIPPYIAYKSFINFINSLQQGTPGRIDRSLMGSMSGSVQAQLLTTLRYLDLISDKGFPKDKLHRFVNSEGAERQSALKDILKSSYSFLFTESFNLNKATLHQLEDQFKDAATGGGTIRKCIKFFIDVAKDSDITLSPYIKKTKIRSGVTRPRRNTPKSSFQKPEAETPPQIQTEQISWSQLLLSKFPSFDPSWPDDVKLKWFDAFDQLMKRGQEQEEEE